MPKGDSDDDATENISELAHEVIMKDDMNKYITQYYNEPSSESGVPGTCIITTAAIDVHHHPNISSDLYSADVQITPERNSSSSSINSLSVSRTRESSETLAQSISSQAFCSSTDCSTREESTDYCPLAPTTRRPMKNTQELLSSFSEDVSYIQRRIDPANLHLSTPAGSCTSSPEHAHSINIYNRVHQKEFEMFHDKSVIPLNLPLLESKRIDAEIK
uniref:Uncharacterized protein n=1 Tax=Leptobrachium leishanense TaxID=445787 RepID=A0A8C5PC74_9ANUR